ncbi:hypothetical protein [Kordia sp.]|uniref:hypothetical protein n=1 Tax=Kordia sp. TaxID=1965332 RepID=UPI0025C28DC3|nr:hypothetical protein [Kordia sp.]MCH2195536.1 hypothetical protein [Kordia sp.]
MICIKVFEKHGMQGVIDGLRTVDTDADFFKFIKEKLGVNKERFSAYVRKIAAE